MLIRLSLLALLIGSCATARPSPPSRGPLPSVDLVTLDGQPARLQQTVAGKVAVVAVWATWCDGCAAEFEALGRLHDRAVPRGAVVVAVAVGQPRDVVARFVAHRGLRYPQFVDEQFRLANALGQDHVPTTLVIDRAGQVVYEGGSLDENALAALRAALDGRVALR
jgi:cytochrome c biogenesis protein CcmG/thiol:disulfide interchange protein DsbE